MSHSWSPYDLIPGRQFYTADQLDRNRCLVRQGLILWGSDLPRVPVPESVGEKVMKIGVSGKRATFMENEPGERRLKFRSLKLLVG